MVETTTRTEQLVINLSRPADDIILNYLIPFDKPLWEDKAREALRVGVVAIKATSPVLDARIVEEKFKDFQDEIKGYLKEYFDKDKGHVSSIFAEFFNPDGRLHQRLEKVIGPGSEFAKKLDPANKESVIASIESIVEELLAEKIDELKGEFSLDKPDSAFSRFHKSLDELKESIASKKAKEEEAELGTQKGRDFQESVYQVIERLGKRYGDVPHYCADEAGLIPKCKTGDIVSEIIDSHGYKIVLEAKVSRYTLKKALEELKEAKENRGAQAGIFVFAKGYEPDEVGSFGIYNQDVVCTFDEEEDVESSMLRAAYVVARHNVIKAKLKIEVGADLNAVAGHIHSLLQEIEKFDGVKAGLDTARRAIESVDKATESLRTEIKKYLDLIDYELKKGPAPKAT